MGLKLLFQKPNNFFQAPNVIGNRLGKSGKLKGDATETHTETRRRGVVQVGSLLFAFSVCESEKNPSAQQPIIRHRDTVGTTELTQSSPKKYDTVRPPVPSKTKKISTASKNL